MQSDILIKPKCHNDTLECTLEEMVILKMIVAEPTITQKELADRTGKSVRTIKRIMMVLQNKGYIYRKGGKRYGEWKILIEIV